jgi:hypothetical protein
MMLDFVIAVELYQDKGEGVHYIDILKSKDAKSVRSDSSSSRSMESLT